MGTISQVTIEGMVIQLDAKKVNGFNVEKDVPSNALFTDTTYNVGAGLEIQNSQTQSLQLCPYRLYLEHFPCRSVCLFADLRRRPKASL